MEDEIENKIFEHLPWTEKYRPKQIEDIFLPQLIKNRMISIINDRNIPNIIITGSPGIGKSSAIKIVAKEIYRKYYNEAVMELGLLDDKSIKFIQKELVYFCKIKIPYKKSDEDKYPKYKLVIFDESDNMISRIQDQISNVMENYSDYIRFIFTCNSSSDICEGIQTKSVIWRFPYISSNLIKLKLSDICNYENIAYDDKALNRICELSQGDLRSAINKLEIISIKYDNITEEHVNNLCITPQEITINKLFKFILEKNLKEALNIIFDLKKKSYSGSDITQGMLLTIKSETCNYIPEFIKIKLADKICEGIYNISNIMDSDLQLCGCIIDMINFDK
jgi:replication factor C subunit 2/4